MKSPKFWIAVLITGILVNILDIVVQGMLLSPMLYSKVETMRTDPAMGALVFGDFVAVLVLAWVMTRVASSFAAGAKGGAAAGFFLGVLVNFPTYHFIFLLFKGVPYSMAWINTFYGIVWYVIAGTILGALMKKPATAPAMASTAAA